MSIKAVLRGKQSWHVETGDVLDVLRTLPDGCVQTCVTSPPYWGLRDYGVAGQLGQEPTPEEYVAKMVAVFREVRRVLRDDGTLWLNLGDSHFSNGGHADSAANDRRGAYNIGNRPEHDKRDFRCRPTTGLKYKDLVGIPWRVAFALQADGWYLRCDCIWHKTNPMPESVTDRPTKSHEYVFLLSKSAHYFYDATAVKEATSGTAHPRGNGIHKKSLHVDSRASKQNQSFSAAVRDLVHQRNLRSVWTIATAPFADAHFATFPPDLVKPCILAGTSEKGACPACGAPWKRLVEAQDVDGRGGRRKRVDAIERVGDTSAFVTGDWKSYVTTGWARTCDCTDATPTACVVLDPFNGAGTTGLVATRLPHRRRYIGIELRSDYAEMARRRIKSDAPLFHGVP